MTKEIDLHGYPLATAIKTIQRLIVKNPKCNKIIVIHGFNNGNVIKEALVNHICIHNNRVIKTLPAPFNEGRTWIYLKII